MTYFSLLKNGVKQNPILFSLAILGVFSAAVSLVLLGGFFQEFRDIQAGYVPLRPFLGIGLMGVFMGVGAYLRLYYGGKWTFQLEKQLQKNYLYQHFQGPDQKSFLQSLNQISVATHQSFGPNFFVLLRSGLQALGGIIGLFLFMPSWTPGAVGLFLLMAIPLKLYRKRAQQLQDHGEKTLSQFIIEGDQQQTVLSLFQLEDWFLQRWENLKERVLHQDLKKLRLRGALASILIVVLFSGISLGAYALADQMVNEKLSLPLLLQGGFFMILLATSLNACTEKWGEILQGASTLGALLSCSTKSLPAQALPSQINSLSLQNVNFSYGEGSNLFGNFSIHFSRGEIVGIFGASGSGKTTLASLLLGETQRESGSILINQTQLQTPLYRSSHVGYLPQNIQLFSGALVSQIPESSDGLFQEWAENFWERELQSLSYKPLSRGQAQKFGLMRALSGNPDILILDEPTSHLDSKTATEVFKHLQSIKANKIIIVISHDKALKPFADKVYTLDHGTLIPEKPCPQKIA